MRAIEGFPKVVFALAVSAAVLAWLASAGAAVAQEPADSEYGRLIQEGLVEFEVGNWSEAMALFTDAHRVEPNARTLRAIGMTLFELRRYVEAIDHLERAMQDPRKALDDEQRRSVQQLLERARRFVGTVRIETRPDDARVLVDGKEVSEREVMLDVGEHQLSAEAEGFETTVMTVTARPMETEQVLLLLRATVSPDAPEEPEEPEEAEPETPVNLLPWILVGSGAALGIAGVVTGLQADSDFNQLEDGCDGDVCSSGLEDTKKRGEVLDTVTNVLWVAGGVAIAAGVVLLLVGGGDESESSVEVTAGAGCDGDGCEVMMRGAF